MSARRANWWSAAVASSRIRWALKPGHVFSIDPQLRVPDETLYIRYEDVVAVTETGVENFTDFLASELDAMEKIVQSGGGMVRKFPPGPPSGQK